MKKLVALLLAVVMIASLCACSGGSKSSGSDFDQWKAYVIEYANAGAPTEDARKTLVDAVNACNSADDVLAVPGVSMFFSAAGVLDMNAWIAAGKPAADTSNMGTPPASGEFSGEPSEEPAA